MHPNFWRRPRSLAMIALVATLLGQSANAQVQTPEPPEPPHCTLTANPVMITIGASSVLTAQCDSTVTSFEWSGGLCSATTGPRCEVTPSVPTTYSIIGIGPTGVSAKASAGVFTGWAHDGIYQWAEGYYLSLHRIGEDTLIGTIYWVYNSNNIQIGKRVVTDVDTFDLLGGKIVDSTATISGTRFFRACKLSYDLEFDSESQISVRRRSVDNSPGVSTDIVNCAARYSAPEAAWTIPRIY